jgi:hypothetical protein
LAILFENGEDMMKETYKQIGMKEGLSFGEELTNEAGAS